MLEVVNCRMAKRKWAEADLIALPVTTEGVSSETSLVEQTAASQVDATPIAVTVHVDEGTLTEELAPTEPAVEYDLGYGPFWDLLARARYTVW